MMTDVPAVADGLSATLTTALAGARERGSADPTLGDVLAAVLDQECPALAPVWASLADAGTFVLTTPGSNHRPPCWNSER